MLFERALVAEGAVPVIANAHVDEVDEFSWWNLLYLSSRLGSLRFEVATAIAPSNLPAQFLGQRAMLPPLSVSLRLEILNQTGSKFGI